MTVDGGLKGCTASVGGVCYAMFPDPSRGCRGGWGVNVIVVDKCREGAGMGRVTDRHVCMRGPGVGRWRVCSHGRA